MSTPFEKHPSLVDSIQSEVAAEASPLMYFIANNARLLVAAAVVFIAALIGYGVHSMNSEKNYTAALDKTGTLLVITDPKQRLAALEAHLPTVPDKLKGSILFAQIEAAQELGDHDKAYATWKALADFDADSKIPATFGMVSALAAQKKYSEALALLDGISSNLSDADYVTVHDEILTYAEMLGDYKRAIQACDALLSKPELSGEPATWQQKKIALEQKLAAAK